MYFGFHTENHYRKITMKCNNLIKSIFVKMTALWVTSKMHLHVNLYYAISLFLNRANATVSKCQSLI